MKKSMLCLALSVSCAHRTEEKSEKNSVQDQSTVTPDGAKSGESQPTLLDELSEVADDAAAKVRDAARSVGDDEKDESKKEDKKKMTDKD